MRPQELQSFPGRRRGPLAVITIILSQNKSLRLSGRALSARSSEPLSGNAWAN